MKKAWAELNDAVEFVGDCISAIPEEMEWVPTTSVRREYVFAKGSFAGEYVFYGSQGSEGPTPPPKPAADRTSPRTPPTHGGDKENDQPIAETIAETQDAAVAPELPSFTRAVTLARTRSMVDLDTEDSSGKRPRTERNKGTIAVELSKKPKGEDKGKDPKGEGKELGKGKTPKGKGKEPGKGKVVLIPDPSMQRLARALSPPRSTPNASGTRQEPGERLPMMGTNREQEVQDREREAVDA